jgi:hypothetical protein
MADVQRVAGLGQRVGQAQPAHQVAQPCRTSTPAICCSRCRSRAAPRVSIHMRQVSPASRGGCGTHGCLYSIGLDVPSLLPCPPQLIELLNVEQQAAVLHGDDPLLVVAGAGSARPDAGRARGAAGAGRRRPASASC